MRRLVLASLRGNSRRLVAGGIAIVMSVGFLSAVLFAMDSARAHITEQVGEQYTVGDLVVERTTIRAADRLREVAGVRSVATAGYGYSRIHAEDGGKNKDLSGPVVFVPSDREMRWQPPAEQGRLPNGPGEIAVFADVAEKNGLTLGDTVVFEPPPDSESGGSGDGNEYGRFADSEHRAEVVGITAQPGTQSIGLFVSEEALTEIPFMSAEAEVLVRGSLDIPKERLRELAGSEARSTSVEEKVETQVSGLTAGVNVYGAMLVGFAGIALFVALLVVTNTFTIVVAQRSRELALYRCVGASRGQVFGSVVVESLLLGLVTSLLGIVVGLGIAAGAITGLNGFLPMLDDAGLTANPASAGLSVLVGVAVTVLAALSPARRATQVAPLAALRPEPSLRARSSAGVLRLVFGALLLLGGAVPIALAIRHDDAQQGMLLGVAGGALSFVGVLLFGPILAPAVVRLLGVIARTAGVPGRVSVTNAVRNPRRTAATTSALLVGVTLITMLTVGAASSQRASEGALNDQMPIDLMVFADRGQEALSASDRSRVRDLDGIRVSASERTVSGRIGDQELPISSVPLKKADAVVRHPRVIGDLGEGVAVLGPSVAHDVGVRDGETVELTVGEQTREFRVSVVSEPLTPQVLLTDRDLDRFAASEKARTTAIWLRFTDADDPGKLGGQLRDLDEELQDATLEGAAPMRALYQQIIDILLTVAVALLGMAVLIALIGVGNTLSLSVLERIRENGLLRALGLTRGQLRATLAIEAALIAGAAVLLGLVLGTAYGYLGTSTLFAAIDQVPSVPLEIPVGRLVLITLVAMAAGVLASVLPARTAANTPPARTL